jgi:hypothetical protein
MPAHSESDLSAPGGRTPRLLFGVLSAVARSSTVDQLCRALAPHTVVVHHDFSQTPDFALSAPNVRFVPEPARTDRDGWGLSRGIVRTLRWSLDELDFDYFQLLTPSCLPIRPLADFEAYVASGVSDANVGMLDMFDDPQVFMTYAYRTFAPTMSRRFRLLWRARTWYFGDTIGDQVPRAGLAIPRAYDGVAQGRKTLKARVGEAVTRMAPTRLFGRHPFGPGFRAKSGGTWFGARPAACETIVRAGTDPELVRYFSRLIHVSELWIPTVLGNSTYRVGPTTHFISPYIEGGHPRLLTVEELPMLASRPEYFGRKFPDDREAPVRLQLLERIRRPVVIT